LAGNTRQEENGFMDFSRRLTGEARLLALWILSSLATWQSFLNTGSTEIVSEFVHSWGCHHSRGSLFDLTRNEIDRALCETNHLENWCFYVAQRFSFMACRRTPVLHSRPEIDICKRLCSRKCAKNLLALRSPLTG